MNKLRLNLITLLLFFSTSLTFSQAISTGISQDRLERYDEFVEQEVEQGRLAGAVTLVYKNGEKVHEAAIGYSDITTEQAMGMDQIFYIQSMTKPIITTALMMLYEEGHFMLNDPLYKYIPEFKDVKVATDPSKGLESEMEDLKRPITIAHLMSHTAGLSHGLGQSELDQAVLKTLYLTPHENIEAKVKAFATMPLVGHPGEQWYYSASPDILSRLIEIFSGQTTADFLQERLFDPLGMKDTGYNLNEEQQGRMAILHTYDDDGKLIKADRQTKMSGNVVFAGANALFSTAQDYAAFARMLLNGGEWNGQRFISSKTLDIMTIDQANGMFQDPGQEFGFGFAVLDDLADSKALGSEGQYYWNGAYCTYFFVDPEEDMVSVMMTQTAPFSMYYFAKMRQMVYQAVE